MYLLYVMFVEMVCDNEQSSSDSSSVVETSLDEDNQDAQRPIGTGVGYASPTNVSPEISTLKNKLKKNPPISEVEVVQNINSSEYSGSMDSTKSGFSTTESTTTVVIDTTTKNSMKNSVNVSYFANPL